MKPVLSMALAATLLTSAALALWTDPPDADAAAALVAPLRRPVTAVVAVAPTSAAAVDTSPTDTSPTTQLPTRAADWPAPSPAGLAAWQAQATLVASRGAAVAAAPASASARPAVVFPYRWIGQLDDGAGAPQQLLASEQRSVGVRLGATLDGRWRLLRNDAGRLLAQALPDGEALPVPGAPPALP